MPKTKEKYFFCFFVFYMKLSGAIRWPIKKFRELDSLSEGKIFVDNSRIHFYFSN
jgi:hypothetical protein